MTDVKGSILGNAVLRREDPTLLTGEDKYFDDMHIDGLGFVFWFRELVFVVEHLLLAFLFSHILNQLQR